MALRQLQGPAAGSVCHRRRSAPSTGLYRTICQAGSSEPSSNANNTNGASSSSRSAAKRKGQGELKLPARGYFSIADTNAEVYSKAGEKFDPAKKGGRYKSEFIWNTDWQEALAREEALQKRVDEARAQPTAASSGFLSLSRVAELDSMDVDLSDVLARKRREEQEARAAAAAAAQARPARPAQAAVFTRKEVAKLGRVSRSMSRSAVTSMDIPELEQEKAAQAALDQAKFDKEKAESQLWTLAFTVAGVILTYTSYSRDVSASYLLGALGGYTYLRMLSKSVDAMGRSDIQGGASALASQPRLLIPLILTLVYNRWNQLFAEDVGLELQLLPMFVGFLTYKLAVITRQFKEVYDTLSGGDNSK